MKDDAIILRRAQTFDINEVWSLLHAEGKAWSVEQILNEIDQLFVLIYRKRIIGVLCGRFDTGRENVSWVAVHPMYPEGSLRTVMIQGLWGVLCRRPQEDRAWAGRKNFSLGQWFGTWSMDSFLPQFRSRV